MIENPQDHTPFPRWDITFKLQTAALNFYKLSLRAPTETRAANV